MATKVAAPPVEALARTAAGAVTLIAKSGTRTAGDATLSNSPEGSVHAKLTFSRAPKLACTPSCDQVAVADVDTSAALPLPTIATGPPATSCGTAVQAIAEPASRAGSVMPEVLSGGCAAAAIETAGAGT